MKKDFKKKIAKNIKLVKEELINLGCKELDTGAVVKEINGENIYLGILPRLLYNNRKLQVWYAIRFNLENPKDLKHYEHQEKYYDVLKELRIMFKKSKYKFFHDEDAIQQIFSHPKPDVNGGFNYKAYCNPEIPRGAWHNHALG